MPRAAPSFASSSFSSRAWAAQATPAAAAGGDLPTLGLTLTDTGFEIADLLQAGRYAVTITNAGTLTDSHFGLGKISDDVTDEQYAAFLALPREPQRLSAVYG